MKKTKAGKNVNRTLHYGKQNLRWGKGVKPSHLRKRKNMSYAISNLTNFLIRSTYWTLSLEHEGNKLTSSCAIFLPSNMGCMFKVTNRNKCTKQIWMYCVTPKSSLSRCLKASSSRTFPLIFFHELKQKYGTISDFTESQCYTDFLKKSWKWFRIAYSEFYCDTSQ